MKRWNKKGLLLAMLAIGTVLRLSAQSVVTVWMHDGTSQSFLMTETDRVYFSGNTYLMVEEDGNLTSIMLDDIRKITCEEVEGLSEDQQPAVSLLPNPVHNLLTLRHLEGRQQVQIYALSGQLMMTTEASEGQPIDVSGLAAGVYMVRTQSCTLKMMKL